MSVILVGTILCGEGNLNPLSGIGSFKKMMGTNPYIPIRSVGSVAQRQVAIQVQAIELLSVASTDYSVNDRLCLINFAIQNFATYFSILSEQ